MSPGEGDRGSAAGRKSGTSLTDGHMLAWIISLWLIHHQLLLLGGDVGLVNKLFPTLETPWTVACQPPLFNGVSQARILEWVGISYSWGILLT